MLLDSRRVPDHRVVETDLCVIGAGAAGIAIAREFANTAVSVCLLEGGGFEYDAFSRSLYEGVGVGTFLIEESEYLTISRLRFFGGSTNHWTGWTRPLDALDFRERSWIPDSGWPISKEDLDPFHRRAAGLLQVRPFDYDAATALPGLADLSFPGSSSDFETGIFHMSPPTRFGMEYRQELVRSRNVRLFLHANVTNIEVDASGRRATRVEVKTRAGNLFRVKADNFVLAAGGIENARLLLVSNRVREKGLGNEHDLVGRYFMDHPHVTAGFAALSAPDGWYDLFEFQEVPGFGHRVIGVLMLTERAQRERRLPSITIYFQHAGWGIPEGVRSAARAFSGVDHLADPGEPPRREPVITTLRVRSEPIPNRDSRIVLTDAKDALGTPMVKLEWRLTPRDGTNVRLAVEMLARELGARSKGRAQLWMTTENPWPNAGFGSHHMGTTRMHTDPRRGVTDENCRVHGVSNLYLAGSSVFPTAGSSNPTLTLVALALRLAEHLKRSIR